MTTTQQATTVTTEEISVNPPKRLLFGPGPTQVHPRVYQAMAQPVVGHLDPYFFEVSQANQHMLRHVFGTENEWTFVISATGSGGMEAAIGNFVEPGMKVVIFANGFFCDRMTEMAKRHGADVVRFEKPWGESFGDSEAAEFIHREKPKVVMYVTAETSTGVFQRGEAICKAAHEVGALVIADCVTSLGAMPIHVDKTGIDIAYSCTQKGLELSSGIVADHRFPARRRMAEGAQDDQRLLVLRHQAHLRLPVRLAPLSSHRLGDAVLCAARGPEPYRGRRPRASLGASSSGAPGVRRRSSARWAWRCSCPRSTASGTSTRRSVPEGVDDAKVRATLLHEHGIEIAGGFGPLAGKVFRIGLMGPLATRDHVHDFLAKFGAALREAGYKG